MSWKKKNNLGKNNKDINKTMAKEELLEKIDKDIINTLTSKERKTFGTLTCNFQKFEISFWKKDTQKP